MNVTVLNYIHAKPSGILQVCIRESSRTL